MSRIKKLLLLFGFALFIATPVLNVATPTNTFAAFPADADPSEVCEKSILGIKPWFRGLSVITNGKCVIAGPGQELYGHGDPLELSGYIWRLALNIIDIALGVVGYIAFFFLLYGGFQFLTGGSNPGQIEKARKTMLNAVIGLVIALGSVAVVDLIFGILG